MKILHRLILILFLIIALNAYALDNLDKELEQNYPNTYNRHSAHQFDDTPLGMLQMQNKLNRDDYILGLEEQIGHNSTPVIYIEPDLTFFLLYKNDELKYYAQDNNYLDLMGIYNTPISTYLIVSKTTEKAKRNSRLIILKKLIINTNKTLDTTKLSKEEIQNTRELLDTNLNWVNKFMTIKSISPNDLNQFVMDIKPLMNTILKSAIHYKMNRLNTVINAIQAKTGSDTAKTMIIFRGNPFHRQNSVVKMVLDHKYKFKADKNLPSNENSHIVYLDAWQLGYDSSIEGLANVMLDQQYADKFYDNSNALRSDFSNKYARQYLPQLK